MAQLALLRKSFLLLLYTVPLGTLHQRVVHVAPCGLEEAGLLDKGGLSKTSCRMPIHQYSIMTFTLERSNCLEAVCAQFYARTAP
eukprot:670900-Amphidinium_carterae.3